MSEQGNKNSVCKSESKRQSNVSKEIVSIQLFDSSAKKLQQNEEEITYESRDFDLDEFSEKEMSKEYEQYDTEEMQQIVS
tara:strand:- start:184 stop:423 length:240 start_codon:yes stop_codon:yes gene_type:complete